jgi:hypothetical protein
MTNSIWLKNNKNVQMKKILSLDNHFGKRFFRMNAFAKNFAIRFIKP